MTRICMVCMVIFMFFFQGAIFLYLCCRTSPWDLSNKIPTAPVTQLLSKAQGSHLLLSLSENRWTQIYEGWDTCHEVHVDSVKHKWLKKDMNNNHPKAVQSRNLTISGGLLRRCWQLNKFLVHSHIRTSGINQPSWCVIRQVYFEMWNGRHVKTNCILLTITTLCCAIVHHFNKSEVVPVMLGDSKKWTRLDFFQTAPLVWPPKNMWNTFISHHQTAPRIPQLYGFKICHLWQSRRTAWQEMPQRLQRLSRAPQRWNLMGRFYQRSHGGPNGKVSFIAIPKWISSCHFFWRL